MADSVSGLTVVFEKDIDEATAEQIKNAIGMFGHVLSVEPIPATPLETHIAEKRVLLKFQQKLFELMQSLNGK